MISALGSTGAIRPTDGSRADGVRRGPAPARVASDNDPSAVSNPVAEMVAAGPPVDGAKVESLRARIAAGDYRPDPQAIAASMIAADLPTAEA